MLSLAVKSVEKKVANAQSPVRLTPLHSPVTRTVTEDEEWAALLVQAKARAASEDEEWTALLRHSKARATREEAKVRATVAPTKARTTLPPAKPVTALEEVRARVAREAEEREWAAAIQRAKARVALDEEREWAERIRRAKAALAWSEEREWAERITQARLSVPPPPTSMVVPAGHGRAAFPSRPPIAKR